MLALIEFQEDLARAAQVNTSPQNPTNGAMASIVSMCVCVCSKRFSASRKTLYNTIPVSRWKLVHGFMRATCYFIATLHDNSVTHWNGAQQTMGHTDKKNCNKNLSHPQTEQKLCYNYSMYECDAKQTNEQKK